VPVKMGNARDHRKRRVARLDAGGTGVVGRRFF
jgi:hypothetical protein